ncbi:MAG: hypothetical protein WC602_02615 [archaeon]
MDKKVAVQCVAAALVVVAVFIIAVIVLTGTANPYDCGKQGPFALRPDSDTGQKVTDKEGAFKVLSGINKQVAVSEIEYREVYISSSPSSSETGKKMIYVWKNKVGIDSNGFVYYCYPGL